MSSWVCITIGELLDAARRWRKIAIVVRWKEPIVQESSCIRTHLHFGMELIPIFPILSSSRMVSFPIVRPPCCFSLRTGAPLFLRPVSFRQIPMGMRCVSYAPGQWTWPILKKTYGRFYSTHANLRDNEAMVKTLYYYNSPCGQRIVS